MEELAKIMLQLAESGCHNINLVTPTPYLLQILAALEIAAHRGLNLPVVYNCGGYESPSALELLSGVIDIYMPDLKFGDDEKAFSLTGARNYFSAVKAAVAEMHRQVGDLLLDADGIAYRGLIVRHLVLPGNLAATGQIIDFIAKRRSRPIPISTSWTNITRLFKPENFPLLTGDYMPMNTKPRWKWLKRRAYTASLDIKSILIR